jgi:hypothetical protein
VIQGSRACCISKNQIEVCDSKVSAPIVLFMIEGSSRVVESCCHSSKVSILSKKKKTHKGGVLLRSSTGSVTGGGIFSILHSMTSRTGGVVYFISPPQDYDFVYHSAQA